MRERRGGPARGGPPPRAAKLGKRSLGRLPAISALVPDPEVWRVCGAGRALIARRRPDGRVAWASCAIDLKRPASLLLFGNASSDEGEFETILENLARIDGCHPMVPGSATLAGRFAWGAYASARARGFDFDELDPELLAVFGRPAATLEESRRLFDGRDGLCEPELLELCRREELAALPCGEQLVTLVAMGFEATHPERIVAALGRDARFAPRRLLKSGLELDWSPDGRAGDLRGSVVVAGARVRADAVSLDHAGLLCSSLKQLAGGALELVAVERRTMQELLRLEALDQAG